MEDLSNRTRLAKLLRFFSSNDKEKQTSLADYVERMKDKQDAIYFIAGSSRDEVRIVQNKSLTIYVSLSKRKMSLSIDVSRSKM